MQQSLPVQRHTWLEPAWPRSPFHNRAFCPLPACAPQLHPPQQNPGLKLRPRSPQGQGDLGEPEPGMSRSTPAWKRCRDSQLTLLEAEEDSRAAAFLAMALPMDLRIMFSLLLAREHFAAREALWLLRGAPTPLRRRVLDFSVALLPGESWKSSVSRPWGDPSPGSAAGSPFRAALGVEVLALLGSCSPPLPGCSAGIPGTPATSCSSAAASPSGSCSPKTAGGAASPPAAPWGRSWQSGPAVGTRASTGCFPARAGSWGATPA